MFKGTNDQLMLEDVGASAVTARLERITIQTTLPYKSTGMVLNFKIPKGNYCFKFDRLNQKIARPEMYCRPYYRHLMLQLTAKVVEAD